MKTLFLLGLSWLLVACGTDANADRTPSISTPTATEAPSAETPQDTAHDNHVAARTPPESTHPYDEEANAEAEINAALTESRRDNKPVLLMFGANWCIWCRRLDHVMEHNARVATLLRDEYHAVHVNVGPRSDPQNRVLIERFGNPIQHGLPVLVIVNAAGEVVHTQETGALESGDHHDPQRIMEFLQTYTQDS